MAYLRALCSAVTFAVPVTIVVVDRVGQITKVVGISMQPVLNPDNHRGKHDYVYLNKWSVGNHKFHRGEIVTFISPRNPKMSLIKRIVGLEGDVISMKFDQDVMVKVPEGHCWVEGENADRSVDSNTFGPVSLSLVVARATHIVWPPSRCQKLDTEEIDADRVQKRPYHKDYDTHRHIY